MGDASVGDLSADVRLDHEQAHTDAQENHHDDAGEVAETIGNEFVFGSSSRPTDSSRQHQSSACVHQTVGYFSFHLQELVLLLVVSLLSEVDAV